MTLPGRSPRGRGGRRRLDNGETQRNSSVKLGPSSSFPPFVLFFASFDGRGLENIIFSRSVRNVSLEFHTTHGQRDARNGIGKTLRMMKFDMLLRGNWYSGIRGEHFSRDV